MDEEMTDEELKQVMKVMARKWGRTEMLNLMTLVDRAVEQGIFGTRAEAILTIDRQTSERLRRARQAKGRI